MPYEPIGSCAPVPAGPQQALPSLRPGQAPGCLPTTPAGVSSYCRDCQRAASRLASRRRRAAVRLLIAATPRSGLACSA